MPTPRDQDPRPGSPPWSDGRPVLLTAVLLGTMERDARLLLLTRPGVLVPLLLVEVAVVLAGAGLARADAPLPALPVAVLVVALSGLVGAWVGTGREARRAFRTGYTVDGTIAVRVRPRRILVHESGEPDAEFAVRRIAVRGSVLAAALVRDGRRRTALLPRATVSDADLRTLRG